MKIQHVDVIVTCPGRNFVAVRVFTDQDGLYGVGDGTLNGRELAVASALTEHIIPLLIGRDPDRIQDIWQYIHRGTYWRGGAVLMTALAAIDEALWDIKGKIAGLPIYSLLGGRTRESALCYTHVHGEDPAEVVDNIAKAAERGYRAMRLQVAVPGNSGTYGAKNFSEDMDGALPLTEIWEPGPYLREIPHLFETVRSHYSFEYEFLHDVHERLTPTEAAQLARELEPYKLFFLEDPIRPEYVQNIRAIRNATTAPLAFGELLFSKWECLPLLVDRLVDYIRCDINHIGGITEAMKIAAIAEPFGIRTAWHGPPDMAPIAHAANVHLDLAIANFGIQEFVEFPDQVYEVFSGMPCMEAGSLTVSDQPGLGADIDERAAAKFPYKRAYLPTVRRRDGSVHDW